MKMKTLRGRLTKTLTLMLVLIFVAQWILLSVAIRKVSQGQMLTHMDHDGSALLETLDFDSGPRPRLDARGIEPIYLKLQSGHYYLVQIDGEDAFRSPSLGDFALATEADNAGQKWHYHTAGPANQPLLVLARHEMLKNHRVTLFVGEDLSETNQEIGELSLASLVVFVPLLLAALLLQGVVVRRALQPLAGVRDQLREVGAGKHAQIVGEVPQEIKPLVDELNRLLVLMQRRLNQSRTAIGNLAHALKTPLAVLFRSADEPGVPPAVRQDLRTQTGAIRERIERELRRARLAGASAFGAGAYFNPAEELPVLIRVLDGVYREKQIDFRLAVPNALLPFDREDLLELLGNLADNACKWAAARVAITMDDSPAASGLKITVADDGPGCADEEMQQILQRGVRLDESKSGHGLGLAITGDIVDFYGGRMDMDRDPHLGGLRVRIELPRPVQADDLQAG